MLFYKIETKYSIKENFSRMALFMLVHYKFNIKPKCYEINLGKI